ncbi:MAG: Fimbrial assembly protein (PilN) [bacterium ADurb.Bin400]|nr:MAG: Fimbrial assembly protein (PilN) [bacterium ADurb.Bin400]
MTINLIPPKLKREKKLKKTVNKVFVFSVFASIALAVVSVMILSISHSVKSRFKQVEQAHESLIEESRKFAELETQIALTNDKLVKIDKAKKGTVLWSQVIQELATVMPEKVSLKTLTMDQEKKGVNIGGEARSLRDIAKLKEKMTRSPYFQNVFFKTSSWNHDIGTLNFSLTAELQG